VTSEKTQKSDLSKHRSGSSKQSDDVEYPREIGGRKEGLEPTRYGDWEKNGRCIDF